MHIRRSQTWLLLGTLLAVALTGAMLWTPPRAIAQERSTPTHPPPPPTRTKPPGPRGTPTSTPVPRPPAPPALPTEQLTATPETPEFIPVTGAPGSGGLLLVFSIALIGLGMLVLAWGIVSGRRSETAN